MEKITIIYGRVSTTKQVARGHSLEEQIHAGLERAKELGESNTLVLTDDGISGSKRMRPKFQEMIKLICSNKVKRVIIPDSSRMARSIVDSAYFYQVCDQHSVLIEGIRFSFSRNTASERLSVNLQSCIDQYYLEDTSERTIRGLKGALQKGIYPFHAPFGYTKEINEITKKKYLVPIPEKIEIVKELYRLYALGKMGCDVLAKISFNGLTINKGLINKILRNQIYTGSFMYQGAYYSNFVEQVIKPQLFDYVQSKLDSNQYLKINTYLFSRKLICSCCGSKLSNKSGTSRNEKVYLYYGCMNKLCEHFKKQISQKKLLEEIEGVIVSRYNKTIRHKKKLSNVTGEKASFVFIDRISDLTKDKLLEIILLELPYITINLKYKIVHEI